MKKIEGDYNFRIFRPEEDDIYLAKCYIGKDEVGMTQGKTKEEIFTMVADFYMTYLDIPCSKWSRFWGR